MALQKNVPSGDSVSIRMKSLSFSSKVPKKGQPADQQSSHTLEPDIDVDLREVYFLIMHFLSAGPCHGAYGQFWNELLNHQLLPRRYHAWYSRTGVHSGDENDDGMSFPLSYTNLIQRYPHIEKNHLVKLLKQLILNKASPSRGMDCGNAPNAADVPTLLGMGSFSLLSCDISKKKNEIKPPPIGMRWPHTHADQVRGLGLREIGGGFTRHHRAPSIRAACYAIAKPCTMVQKMQNLKRLRGHRNAVYCATFDRLGRYVVTGSDDRLVKIWSMETAYCLASCRGHEGDITDLAVSSNNAIVASSSNDCIIRVWRLPDGLPISVLRGHTGAVTAIAFNPKPGCAGQLLSSSDDGTCRIWDARSSQSNPRIYIPKPSVSVGGKNNGPSSSNGQQSHQIFCCAFNANGSVFVTGSSDSLARVYLVCNTPRSNADDSDQPIHEIDVLAGHENDVNYVQFSGCAVASRFSIADCSKEENVPKFKNSRFSHDNIVTCSRDGSAIIWVPRSRRSHGKNCRWTRAYHLKVPPPPAPPQPPRGGPRQRILPTPRGVNMIVWSLDNRFVLAAIMDCRICVWNASDGSLVHSLTGHTESTYVLDVHPFNPRIAMSAGYDGKMIVWDIWEGNPIRIYEISRFKLVDGKFSPDGTSITLSDDVGQVYILSTGQGESQKDAKYDQFYLGDYRPIIQDVHGNVLDQETQLTPYRRNIEDPLCDSGMIPYPEPYQTMFQQRRLGALGREWRPSSLKLTVGPDITLDMDYQMPPLADLDIVIDPLPEFLDAMDWEPENEVQSDDDSEYNVTEEYSTGGEQGSLCPTNSGDSVCSSDDSDMEISHKDCLRRSKRKKPKAEIEIMTSSGRRVKRRNLDDCDGMSIMRDRTRKSSNGRKASRKKSSTSKSSRPQRAAARNALTLFSKITGTSTDAEDGDGFEGDLSESESIMQYSNLESDESDRSLVNQQSKHLKGKEVSLGESEDAVTHHVESHKARTRERLVLKLPVRDPKKPVMPDSLMPKCDYHDDLVGASSSFHQAAPGNKNIVSSLDPGDFSGHENNRIISKGVRRQLGIPEDRLDLLEGYRNGDIRWGGVKARTSKRIRLTEAMSTDACFRTGMCLDYKQKENDFNNCSSGSPHLEYQTDGNDKMHNLVLTNVKTLDDDALLVLNEVPNSEEHPGIDQSKSFEKSPKEKESLEDATTPSFHTYNVPDHLPEPNESLAPTSTKLRLRSKGISKDPKNLFVLKMKYLVDDNGNSQSDDDCASDKKCNTAPEVPKCDGDDWTEPAHADDELQGPDNQTSEVCFSGLPNSGSHSHSKKMYDVVYKRSKLHKGRTNSEGNTGGKGENNTNVSNHNDITGTNSKAGTSDGAHRMLPNGLKAVTSGSNIRSEEGHESDGSYRNSKSSSLRKCQITHEEWGASSRTTVGLRSARNRRTSYYRESSPVDRRKSCIPSGKGSWLMLSTHEEGSRYIPQKGDEVVYLRQGHQEYIDYCGLKDSGPWTSIKENIRPVEFCRVEGLEYSTLPGSGDNCCKMTLKFIDPNSSLVNRSFKLTLPEVTGFPDFLVERTRYDAAMQRNWTCRDKCRVWWRNEGEEDGSWWDGRILSVKPKSLEFPDSPWERYTIRYKSDPAETHLHSPWELFDADTLWEQPHIDDESRNKLISAFAKLHLSGSKVQDPYGVKKLKQVSHKSSFTNRFPVPLSLEVIQSRSDNNYYRSLEALKHDVSVVLTNAESYFGKNAELMMKIRRLSDWFRHTLSHL